MVFNVCEYCVLHVIITSFIFAQMTPYHVNESNARYLLEICQFTVAETAKQNKLVLEDNSLVVHKASCNCEEQEWPIIHIRIHLPVSPSICQ